VPPPAAAEFLFRASTPWTGVPLRPEGRVRGSSDRGGCAVSTRERLEALLPSGAPITVCLGLTFRSSVSDLPPPPVEWVSARGRWWVFRFGVPAIVVGILLAFFFYEWATDPSWAEANFLYAELMVLGALGVDAILLWKHPSVRRIGISPLYLAVDIGIIEFTYSWPEVRQVTRVRIDRFRANQLDSASRTRIAVGSGLSRTWYTLSLQQGDRLARFLRIP
jgi:hypothetical protein